MSRDLLSRITVRADQCHGRPCVRGMRIRVVDVLEMLAGGASEAEILADFPDLERDDIRACLAYAVTQLGHPVVEAAEQAQGGVRFIVDAQLTPQLAAWLRERGHEAKAVRKIGLRDATDAEIWKRAARDAAVLVTKDEDFAEMAGRLATGPRVLWVRTGNMTNRVLLRCLESAWPRIELLLAGDARLVELR